MTCSRCGAEITAYVVTVEVFPGMKEATAGFCHYCGDQFCEELEEFVTSPELAEVGGSDQ